MINKMVGGRMIQVEAYFLTDLVKYMVLDSRPVGHIICENESESMGIDAPASLEKAQRLFAQRSTAMETMSG